MRFSISILSFLWLACSFATLAVANEAMATITPCPKCPKSLAPAIITVTEQYQPVSTCKPARTCKRGKCKTVLSVVSSYPYVSTVIPCLENSTTVTVTKTEQIIPLQHHSSVTTTVIPCITEAPATSTAKYAFNNGTYSKTATCTPKTEVHTVVTDISCPYNQLGPIGNVGYGGSGLCDACVDNPEGNKYQNVTMTACVDQVCKTYTQTWAVTKTTSATSVSTAHMSATHYCPSNGVYPVPISSAYTPSGDPVFTEPATTTVTYTTTVTDAPVVVTCESSVPIEFTAPPPQPTEATTSYVTEPMSISTYCPSNGAQTIPIVTTYTPTGEHSSLFTPVVTTVYYTTSVTNAPTEIECTTTVTITLTESTCPYETIVHESTEEPTNPVTEPAPISAEPTTEAPVPTYEPEPTPEPESTTSEAPEPTYEPSPISTYGPAPHTTEVVTTETPAPTYETAPPTSTPSAPAMVDTCDYSGCYGSSELFFPTFNMVTAGGHMTIETCIDECQAQYLPYAGLYKTDCYCGESIEHFQSHPSNECAAPCPGNKLESCGGGDKSGHVLLDIYECPIASSTTSSPTATSSSGPENSSDPDPEPESYHHEAPPSHRLGRRDNRPLTGPGAIAPRRAGVIRAPRAHVIVGGGNSNRADLSMRRSPLLAAP